MKQLFWLTLLIVYLPACTLFTESTFEQAASPKDAEAKINALETWQAKGKIGLKTEGDGGSVFFRWQQKPDQFEINLHGPLGQGATKIFGNRNIISAQSKKLGTVSAATPEALFHQQFGWDIPLSNLQSWIKGTAAPTGPQPTLILRHPDHGRLQNFEQANWHISIARYQSIDGYLLPRKMTAISDDIKVTVAISKWTIGDDSN